MSETEGLLRMVLEAIHSPFWARVDFWISTLLGLGGLLFLLAAFVEARQAKRAATDAGRTVKLHATTMDLTELSQKLDRIPPELLYNEARDLLAEISRRLRRLVSPFAKDDELSAPIHALREALANAQESLKLTRPTAFAAEPATADRVLCDGRPLFDDQQLRGRYPRVVREEDIRLRRQR